MLRCGTFSSQTSLLSPRTAQNAAPSTMSRFVKRGKPPTGFDYISPTLSMLENELREKVSEGHEGKRKVEALWPVHQINWQRSRYVYDMYYKYKKISREVYS